MCRRVVGLSCKAGSSCVNLPWADVLVVLWIQTHFNCLKFLINSNMQTTVRSNKSSSPVLCLPRLLCSSFSVNVTLLISMSVAGYPNAITDNYAPCCACVYVCVHFSLLGGDALINRQLWCCMTASHTDYKGKATLPGSIPHTHIEFALCLFCTQGTCHSHGHNSMINCI